MIVGDRLAELLIKNGVDRVFGLPGGQNLPLYEGIRKQKEYIEHILMRDERSAGFAASRSSIQDKSKDHLSRFFLCTLSILKRGPS
ncbi:hypothetical protein KJ966_30340 [bacterium]|nr:hypothetical protein [bacterium]